MKIKRLLLAIILMSSISGVFGQSKTVADLEPGLLGEKIGNETDITSLTIVGTMDASDFDFINKNLTDLTTLNLGGVTISAYDGKAVLLHRTKFEADYLPDYALAGMGITSITLPAGLKTIGEGALSSSAIESLDLSAYPDLVAVGDGAFSNCANLTEVVLSSATTLGTGAFSRCSRLTTVSVTGENIYRLPAQSFLDCPMLSTVSLGSVAVIGDKAFYGCSALTGVQMPSTLTAIGESAFQASGLTELDLSTASQLASIGAWAFANCDNLESVTMGSSVRSFGEGLFFDDPKLVSARVPRGVTELPDYIFKGDVMIDTTAWLHNDITHIGNYALKDIAREGLDEVTLPANLEYIGDNGMAGMTSLKVIDATSLIEVPELGEDVWDGVDQPNVTLKVMNKDMHEKFAAEDQWNLFTIDAQTGIDNLTGDGAGSGLKAWFEGTNLILANEAGIEKAAVYDANGRLYVTVAGADSRVVVDTADFVERLYLVTVTLADGTETSVKIAR